MRSLFPSFQVLGVTCSVLLASVAADTAHGQTPVFFEDFDGVNLEPVITASRVNAGDGTDWTDFPPPGWTIDNSLLEPGTIEFNGWTFVDPAFWVASAGQNRNAFTKGQNVIAVADADEWDDEGNPASRGAFNSFLTTPSIAIGGSAPNTLQLRFDSSWRPFADMTGTVTVAYNNGAPTEVLRFDASVPADLNGTVLLPLNNPAGANQMTLTWGLADGGNDWWWAIDNVGVFAGDSALSLTVDRDNGALTLFNGTGQTVAVSEYAIRSEFGGLDSGGWLSIAENYDSNSGGSVDPTSAWNVTSDPADRTTLSEADSVPATGAMLAPGQTVILSLGDAWIKSPIEDVVLEYTTNGSVRSGLIEFVGNNDQAYLVADLDFDNDIDLDDWVTFRQNQHTDLSALSPAEAYQRGDLNGDLLNNHADFVQFKSIFNAANGAGALEAALAGVPEPATWVTLVIVCLPLFRLIRIQRSDRGR